MSKNEIMFYTTIYAYFWTDYSSIYLYSKNSILALYWETHFFSHELKHQSYADEIFQKHARLPRYLDFDNLVKRAGKYQEVEIYRKLLQITLQFDLDPYEQGKAMNGLLIHYCEYTFLLLTSLHNLVIKSQ